MPRYSLSFIFSPAITKDIITERRKLIPAICQAEQS